MTRIMRNDGSADPSKVHTAPRRPLILYPINVEMLMAKTPGQLCEIAIRSKNSSFSIHLFFSTTSFSIIGIMAYPPPRVNAPILKKVLKRVQFTLLCPPCGRKGVERCLLSISFELLMPFRACPFPVPNLRHHPFVERCPRLETSPFPPLWEGKGDETYF